MVKWVIFLVGIIIILLYSIERYFFSQVVTRKVGQKEDIIKVQTDRGLLDLDYYNKLYKEEVTINSKDGLQLKGIYLKNNGKENKTIIFVHGITANYYCSIKYMDIFYKRGWNVLIYDQRRHGDSEGKFSTYGYKEKEDLDLWVNWVVKKNGENSIIGLHGESMGAATVLQYASINKYAKFIIADCAFSNLEELLKIKLKESLKVKGPILLNMCSLRARRKAGFSFKAINPIEVVKDSTIPIMFIHGKEDKFIPYYMSEKMYEAKDKGVKALYLAEKAGHARSIEVDIKKYEDEVLKFVNNVI